MTDQEDPPRILIGDLCDRMETYLDRDQVKQVYRAFQFSAAAHEGQRRRSGEPYIFHPIAVTWILAELKLDATTLCAALLHDVLEDTGASKDALADEFGEQVADLVDGVSKLNHLEFSSRAEAQAATFRKMIMAMTQDIRVILVKLADRLHNMRTIQFKKLDSRRRIARETLDIYGPISGRLGMNIIRQELESLSFEALYPWRSKALQARLEKAQGNQRDKMLRIEITVRERLEQYGIEADVYSLKKHPYSTYRKMAQKKLLFKQITDVFGFRVIVDDIDTCYRVLGMLHGLYKPRPGGFKDYIAMPKANGYQSLHTLLVGPDGETLEIQIRTQDMHRYAEYGVAAHGIYKSGEETSSARRRTDAWLHGLMDLQKNTANPMEFLEAFKIDLFPDEIYVFTPGSDIIELPRGATAVDFAYAVHTDLGNKLLAAKIDGELSLLHTPLQSGQTVEVITANWARPHVDWLDFSVSAKARSGIRGFLKNLKRNEAILLGQRILDKVLGEQELSVETLSEAQRNMLAQSFNLKYFDDLLEEIGLGRRAAFLVAHRLQPDSEPSAEESTSQLSESKSKPLVIKGTENMVVTLGKCCRPIPGDLIRGEQACREFNPFCACWRPFATFHAIWS
ncbi:MAG: bifunctional (p)ppGpp synthetase/guanosine-3',5'-bis(diphosphate) 3'-pyrophosphohydrolase, partial [Pseudomonadota bacterium]